MDSRVSKSIEEQLKVINKVVHNAEVKKITVRGKKILLSDVLETILPFGKYKGERLGNIAESDRDYAMWLVTQDFGESRLELKLEALVIAMNEGEV